MFCYFREMSKLSGVLRSKNEESEAYLSEIEVGLLFVVEWNLFYIWQNFMIIQLVICFYLFQCYFWSIAIWMMFLQTIGQAYDDMQTQNQHLLQQITERDDYNIKVVCLQIACILYCDTISSFQPSNCLHLVFWRDISLVKCFFLLYIV